MKQNLLSGFIAIFLLVLFSCSNKYYTASNFEEKTEKHKVVAILPAEVTFSGKQPKNLSPEDIAKAEEKEDRIDCDIKSSMEGFVRITKGQPRRRINSIKKAF